ncbi:MAG: diguanylate cyclase [Anaerolineaceae bacterium]|nr:diguanylate cyclase [Anaerolineaceae bacterium]
MTDDLAFYKSLVDNLQDGVYFVDRDRIITYWNKGAERITGYKSRDVIGRSCRDNILNHVNTDGLQLCQDHCPLAGCMQDGEPREADVFLHHADGYRVPVLVRTAPIMDAHGNITGSVETFNRDNGVMGVRTELRELRHSVNTDKLTGVGNRRFLDARLHSAISELSYERDLFTGLVMMDIDNFKQVNDMYGHDAGDLVLRMVAATLQHNLRKTDVLGRWGGEEFLVILYGLVSAEWMTVIAETLRSLVESSRLDLEAASLSATISTGATLLRPDDTPETALHRVDGLLYKSKWGGRNQVSVG